MKVFLDKHHNVLSPAEPGWILIPLGSAAFHSAVGEHSYVRVLASCNNLYKQKFQQRLLLARLLGKSSPRLIIMEFIDHVHTVRTYKDFCELLPRLQYKINTQVIKYDRTGCRKCSESSKQPKQQKAPALVY